MFCPRCGAEYRRGFTECADCRIPLVPGLPSATGSAIPVESAGFIEVLATFSPADTALAKSLLDGEGIAYFTTGEGFNQVYPYAAPVRFLVRRDQASAAREILGGL